MDLIKCRLEAIKEALLKKWQFKDCDIFDTIFEQRKKGVKNDCDGFYIAPSSQSWEDCSFEGTGNFSGKTEIKEVTGSYKIVGWFSSGIDIDSAVGVFLSCVSKAKGDILRKGIDSDLIFREEFPESDTIPNCKILRIDFKITALTQIGDCFCEKIKIECTNDCTK